MQADASVRVVPARLLEFRAGACVAFAAHVTMGLAPRPAVLPVPGAPRHCPGLIAWNDRWVPLIDLAALVDVDVPATVAAHVLILRWRSAASQAPSYGAVEAPSLVRMADVADTQWCDLPTDSPAWPRIASSCFQLDAMRVPILDTARLFGQAHPVGRR